MQAYAGADWRLTKCEWLNEVLDLVDMSFDEAQSGRSGSSAVNGSDPKMACKENSGRDKRICGFALCHSLPRYWINE